jgi:hypothetical protein
MFKKYLPNFQSDFFRWWYLKEHGGFYLDTDQIILKSFSSLPLDNNLIYSQYKVISCGTYAPVGVIGASKDSKIVLNVNKHLTNFYKKDQYNSIGPDMFKNVLAEMSEPNIFNAPSHYFYPINESWLITDALAEKIKISEESFAFHWFGGNPISQRFNKVFTREFAMENDDTLSTFVKQFNW